jgi:hypothetical protein
MNHDSATIIELVKEIRNSWNAETDNKLIIEKTNGQQVEKKMKYIYINAENFSTFYVVGTTNLGTKADLSELLAKSSNIKIIISLERHLGSSFINYQKYKLISPNAIAAKNSIWIYDHGTGPSYGGSVRYNNLEAIINIVNKKTVC